MNKTDFLIWAATVTVALLIVIWLGGRAYDWCLHRAMKRASDDTSWAYGKERRP